MNRGGVWTRTAATNGEKEEMPDWHGFDAMFVLLMVCGLTASLQRREHSVAIQVLVALYLRQNCLVAVRVARVMRRGRHLQNAAHLLALEVLHVIGERRAPHLVHARLVVRLCGRHGILMRTDETRAPAADDSRERNRGEHAAKLRIV